MGACRPTPAPLCHFFLLTLLIAPSWAAGKCLSQCGRGAQSCPALGQLELLELAVSGSGQPPSAATTTGESVLARHGRGQHPQQRIGWSPVALYILVKFQRKLLT